VEGPGAVRCSVEVEGPAGSTGIGAVLLKVMVVVFFFALGRREHWTSEAGEQQERESESERCEE
jgi:hypothetical protein